MSEQFLIDIHSRTIERQMNEDMQELMTREAMANTHTRNVKLVPAYEEVDVFERQRIETNMRLNRERHIEAKAQGRMIYPDDPNKPKIRMIMPNE